MDIQDIAVSHNQKKKLLKKIKDSDILFEDENGDLIVNVGAYKHFRQQLENCLLEEILVDEYAQLDWTAKYFVFN